MDHEVRMQRREFSGHGKYEETIPGTVSSRSIFDVQQVDVFFDRVFACCGIIEITVCRSPVCELKYEISAKKYSTKIKGK